MESLMAEAVVERWRWRSLVGRVVTLLPTAVVVRHYERAWNPRFRLSGALAAMWLSLKEE